MAFLALLALLALHAFSTMGVFVVSDDLAWMQRAAADAHKPWNAFVQPLFADYYRPIPELVWTLNYSLWGFDFDGHQLMFILMWLTGVCAVYAVGCRLAGRVAGFAAATLIGLNDTYLLISSWKSWYTTLTEFVAVLTCVWAALKWLEGRRARYAVAAAALALIAVLSRELATLVLSAMALFALVLPGFRANGPEQRKRAIRWLIVWAILTGGVLLALPSYRSGISKWLKGEPAASTAAGAGTSRGAYVWRRFSSHARGIFGVSTAEHRFGWGVSACLVWFAALLAWFRGRRERPELARRYRLVLLGAFLLGTVLLGVPWSIRRFGEKAELFSIENLEPVAGGMLILAFCAAAFAGDRLDRMLGAWFVAGFVPVLFLQHLSNAYHLLALTALVLFTARGLAGFAQDELLPAMARLRGRAPAGASTSAQGRPEHGREGGPDDDARYLLVGIFAVLAIIQIMMLRTNVQLADSEIRKRVESGRMMKVHVDRAVQDVLAHAGPAKRVCVAPNSWAELAGLILREKCGFKEEKLDQAEANRRQFSDPQVPIRADASR